MITFCGEKIQSLAQTLSLPEDSEEDIFNNTEKEVIKEAHFSESQSTYLEMDRLDVIHESSDSDQHLLRNRCSIHRNRCSNVISSHTHKCVMQANNISMQQTNVTEVASIIETPIQNSELWLLRTLDYYENQAKSMQESNLIDQANHHYQVYEVNRSEFRQVKWLVGELRHKLRNLLAERDEEVDKSELEPKLVSGGQFNLPESCISQHLEDESIPGTGDYLVTKLEQCSRQISSCCPENNDFQMRKRIAKCSTFSDFYCDNRTVNAATESIEEEVATNCNKNLNKYRRLSR